MLKIICPSNPRGILFLLYGVKKYGETTKRMYRLTPHLVHVCGFIWEWIKTIRYSIVQGALGEGVRGSKIQKPAKAAKRLDRL